jgi:hydrogenase maturation factor HypF (carbamoyltransferase family)
MSPSLKSTASFVAGIRQQCPPLAQIDSVERKPVEKGIVPQICAYGNVNNALI